MSVAATKFVRRQLDPNFAGTKLSEKDLEAVVTHVTSALEGKAHEVRDGYAPFCKEVRIPGLFVRSPIVRITGKNRGALQRRIERRRDGEPSYIQEYFPVGCGVEETPADHLTVIVYSRAQLEEEAAKAPHIERDVPDAEWGIVSINAEPEAMDSPMAPMTLLRNALGAEYGGSGKPLDLSKYEESVAYWVDHAKIA